MMIYVVNGSQGLKFIGGNAKVEGNAAIADDRAQEHIDCRRCRDT